MKNSLGAKSTRISVVAEDGGMKLLQVQDNGCGSRVDDLPLTCIAEKDHHSKYTAHQTKQPRRKKRHAPPDFKIALRTVHGTRQLLSSRCGQRSSLFGLCLALENRFRWRERSHTSTHVPHVSMCPWNKAVNRSAPYSLKLLQHEV